MPNLNNFISTASRGNWNQFICPLNNPGVLSKESLSACVDSFWSLIEESKDWGEHVLQVYVTIEYEGEVFKSLGKAAQVNREDFSKFKSSLIKHFSLKDDFYHTVDAHNISFNYNFVSTKDVLKSESVIHDPKKSGFDLDSTPAMKSTDFKGYNLPNNMNLFSWGRIIASSHNSVTIDYKSKELDYTVYVKIEGDSHIVSIEDEGRVLLNFTDVRTSGNNSFTRTINRHEFVYRGGEMVIKYDHNPIPGLTYISKVDKCKNLLSKIITFDIETRLINSVVTPYCICFYDGVAAKSFYVLDFDSVDSMIKAALSAIFKPEYSGYIVYAHNLSKFDGILILKTLANMRGIKLRFTKNESNFINIQVRGNKNNKFCLDIRDSYLLLPSSLRSLTASFGVLAKSIFPFTFLDNLKNPLDYIGARPDFKYYEESGISRADYDAHVSGQSEGLLWSVEVESRRYCAVDCISLWKVLIKFNDLIYTYFGINAIKYPTIPSLAFAIFRSHYMNHKIPVLVGPIYDFIKASYTGGSVDVYIPNPKGYFTELASSLKNIIIRGYDVNSLYPAAMLKSLMPIGKPCYFKVSEGVDFFSLFNKDEDRPLGFFKVEVTAPDNLQIPILQTRLETPDGYRTVSPIGTWTGIYFSSELYNAIKNFGYEIKVLEGYTFEGQHIFKDYVEYFYAIKKAASKDDPMYYIAKLFMNSLYGRFGMSYEQVDTKLVTGKKLDKLISDNRLAISGITDLSSGKKDVKLVSIFNEEKYNAINKAGIDLTKYINISVGIASAITAEARVIMSAFKTIPGINILYGDTDSAYVDQPLPDDLVGDDLGQFKLEGTYKDIVFLAPKMYAAITTEGLEVIKVKGVTAKAIKSNNLNFDTLKQLLFKDKEIMLNQVKSFRSVSDSNIKIVDQTYTMVATENKRELVYDSNGILVHTKPLKLPLSDKQKK